MKTWALVLVLVVVGVCGCKTATAPVVRLASVLDSSGAPLNETYQIPIEKGKIEEPAGWEDDKVLQIVVPDPRGPSHKPTTINVKKKKKSVLAAILPTKSATNFDMTSDNPDATAKEEPQTPWWYWLLGAIMVLGVGWFIVGKYLGPIKAFGGGAWALVSKLWKWRK